MPEPAETQTDNIAALLDDHALALAHPSDSRHQTRASRAPWRLRLPSAKGALPRKQQNRPGRDPVAGNERG